MHAPRRRTSRLTPLILFVTLTVVASLTAFATAPPAAAATTTITTFADARVNSGRPTTTYGSATSAVICRSCALSGAPTNRMYLKFDVSRVTGTVTSAQLRLYATTTSLPSLRAHRVGVGWTEATVTWNNAPAPGPVLGSSAPKTSAGYVDIPLSSLGTGAFVVQSSSATVVRVATRETATRPQLVVTTQDTPPASTPNVLLVNLDDGRYDAPAYLPKTAAWMASGVTYQNSYVTIPACCPSRATLFTGKYSHNNGVTDQDFAPLLDKDHTLAAYLDRAGYQTAMAGKFLLSWPTTSPPPNFDRHTVIQGGYYNFTARVEGISRTVAEYSTTFLGAQLRGYLKDFEASDATPWFGYLAPQAPHINGGWKTLAVPETKYASTTVGECMRPGEPNKSDKPPYMSWVQPDPTYVAAMCQSQARTLLSVDDQIDLLFQQLQADGELANTIVVITSDNGFMWGEHDRWEKFIPYEPSVRVPLLVRWDGHVAPGASTRRVATIDILPTILEAAGITPLKPLDGRSLLSATGRTETFSEYFYDNDDNGPTPSWALLSNGARKYIETYDSAGNVAFREYYRLDSDPGELTNVLRDGTTANDPPATELTQLAAQLAAARSCAGSTCP